MSLLQVGLSHRTAPLPVLERYALDRAAADKLALDLGAATYVGEAVVVTTCNRVEVFADVERFHACVDEVVELLARACGTEPEALVDHLSVRYEEAVVAHAFEVACGLDSMAVGESQVLGQLRDALAAGQRDRTVGPELNALFQQALRVGKRVHTETELDAVGRSLVHLAFADASSRLGALTDRTVLVVGAGAMAGLAVAQLRRDHGAQVLVANRTRAKADRLAAAHGATAVDIAAVADLLGRVDLVVSCTGAPGAVLSYEVMEPAVRQRSLLVVDLSMPRDVTAEVAALDGVTVLDLESVANRSDVPATVIEPVRAIVAAELAAHRAERRRSSVGPTVAALRKMAREVTEAELDRLRLRTPHLSADDRAQVDQTVNRVVDKLLHTPTVRVKELADQPAASSYADALSDLFALDPTSVHALSRPALPGPASAPGPASEEGGRR
jgi:glutamyl-tRNA reductase